MPNVLLEIKDSIATVTLNRPSELNVLDPNLASELHDTVTTVESNDDVRCMILTGAGDNFMAGGDINYFAMSLQALKKHGSKAFYGIFDKVHGVIRTLRRMDVPVVASVRGAVAGYGIGLMAACDLAISTEDAKFALAYTHIGASPDGGTTYALPRIVGLKRATELLLLGDRFDAQTAYHYGLINYVVKPDELEVETWKLAERLAKGSRESYARVKALLNTSLSNSLDAQLEYEHSNFLSCAITDDFAEGVLAFCEKREPSFTG